MDHTPRFRTRVARGLLVAVLGALALAPARGAGAGVPGNPDPVGVWPLRPAPEVVRAFDPPSDPFGPGHRGVDLAGAAGQVVHAALGGSVTYAGRLAGRGVVVIDHGPTRTTYEPVAATVQVGDALAQGDRIGALQLVGSHCFPAACLHWGWLRGEVYLNPLDLVGRQPVRLLPLSSTGGATVAWSAGRSLIPLPYAVWRPLIAVFLALRHAETQLPHGLPP